MKSMHALSYMTRNCGLAAKSDQKKGATVAPFSHLTEANDLLLPVGRFAQDIEFHVADRTTGF